MWPFNDNLRNQDGGSKYREWLRRWLLSGWFRYVAVGTLALILVTSLIWAAVMTWGPAGVIKTIPELPVVEDFDPQVPADSILDRLDDALDNTGAEEQPPNSTAVDVPPELPAPAPDPADNPGLKGPADRSVPEPGAPPAEDTTAAGIRAGSMEKPLAGEQSAGYGLVFSENFGDYRFNPGLDLVAEAGTAVKAALEGRVKSVTRQPYQGYTVILDHGAGWTTTYAGLETVKVEENQAVQTGALLGMLQAHDHDGLQGRLQFVMARNGEPVDPEPYLLD
ncbi:MAG: peptidoglycan DD-metalloendopeptidase family protein [Bacillota bacterium]